VWSGGSENRTVRRLELPNGMADPWLVKVGKSDAVGLTALCSDSPGQPAKAGPRQKHSGVADDF
jgi:hypothetical protein